MTPAEPEPTTTGLRVHSIDALRGLVMLSMVFVNDIAGMKAAPWWMKHYAHRPGVPQPYDGMTWVDWVFPAFLFVVGMSIPFAMLARSARLEPWWKTALHVLARTTCLLVIGVFMVNRPSDAARMGWPAHLWETLALVASMLFVVGLPKRWTAAAWVVRSIGAIGLIYLGWAFVGPEGARLRTQWWGILGLIGWAYLVGTIVWAVAGSARAALAGTAAILLALFSVEAAGKMPVISVGSFVVNNYLGLGSQIGTHGAIVVLGILLSSILLPDSELQDDGIRVRWTIFFAAMLLVGAAVAYPLHGINKDVATPSWALISAAATAVLFVPLYLWVDARGGVGSSWLLRVAGQNALMIYLLQATFYQLVMLTGADWYGRIGAAGLWSGYGRGVGLGVAMTLLAWGLSRAGIRLRL